MFQQYKFSVSNIVQKSVSLICVYGAVPEEMSDWIDIKVIIADWFNGSWNLCLKLFVQVTQAKAETSKKIYFFCIDN